MSITHQLALVSESEVVSVKEVLKVSAALQKQASRDLSPIWEVSATVDAFESLEDIPPGYWPMILMDNIGRDGADGIHEDENGQPIAFITASSRIDEWSLTASHEALEMLVDPFGNRMIAGDSPKEDQGRVNFLVEVADPCETPQCAYSINGILVSDFYTPNYFDPLAAAGVRYSFSGAITEPHQVLPGGYLSWKDPVTGHWWQETWFDGKESSFRDLGPIDAKVEGNIRVCIDRITNPEMASSITRALKQAPALNLAAAMVEKSSDALTQMWRRQINELIRRPSHKVQHPSASGRRTPRRIRA